MVAGAAAPVILFGVEMSEVRTSIETRTTTPFGYLAEQNLIPKQLSHGAKPAFVQWRRVRTVSDSEEYQVISRPEVEEHWYDWIVELFKKPSPEKLCHRELEDARRNLLECQRLREYYENMVRFETKRIRRLRKMLDVEESLP